MFITIMLPKPVENLIKHLSRLPGVGPKFAERLAFFLANEPKTYLAVFADALSEFSKKIQLCSICGNISEGTVCPICKDQRRDKTKICVVESASDIFAIEKTGHYKGLYHILGGVISPHRNLMPENLRITQLIKRVSVPDKEAGAANKKNSVIKVEEVIIATNPSTEGDTTALYIGKILAPHKIKITRLGRGLPTGGELEYMDETTLVNAIIGRRNI